MRVTVVVPDRLVRTPNGKTWADGSCTYPIYARHLAVFDEVRVVARLRTVEDVAEGWQRVDGPQVTVDAFPYFFGPLQYLRRYLMVLRAASTAIRSGDLPVLRLPAWHLTGHVASHLQRRRYPYAVEVMGDAVEIFSAPSNHHPLRSLVRILVGRRSRRACRGALAALYVTRESLQMDYPAAPDALTIGCSDVSLPSDAYSPHPRSFLDHEGPWRIVFVGGLENLRKAPDVLLEAVAICNGNQRPVELVIVGGGRHQPDLEELAESRGVSRRVRFLGHLPAGDEVRKELDRAQLFVLPSNSEGLPRSMLEAMARGLPCIGSAVGGIPELLPAENLVPPGKAEQLASKIVEMTGDPQRMDEASRRNLEVARSYADSVLDGRRTDYYQAVRARFAHWLAKETS